MRHFMLLSLSLLMLSSAANAHSRQNGLVPFDYSDVPILSNFEFDLDRSTIALDHGRDTDSPYRLAVQHAGAPTPPHLQGKPF